MRTVYVVVLVLVSLAVGSCDAYRYKESRHRKLLQRAGMSERHVTIPTGTIRYWEGGSGPTVLLLHGFGGHALWQWSAQAGPLVDCGLHVVAPDLGWFGETVPSQANYTVGYQATMFAGLMDRLEVDRFDVVGSSYGGLIAREMAVHLGDRVRRLVLADSPGPGYGREDYEALLQRFDTDSIVGLLIPRRPSDVRRLLQITFFDPPHVPGFALRDIYRGLFTQRVVEKTHLLEEVEAGYRSGEQGVPAQRTLVVWGEQDRLFPVELAHDLARSGSDEAKIEIVPRAGHVPNLERPEEFNRRLLEFFECPTNDP